MSDGHEEVVLRTAHDVRHLRVCAKCGGIGDDRRMVEIIPARRDDRWHPRCFYEEFGEIGVLELRSQHQEKFRLCDIPIALMRKLLERIS